MVRPRPVLDRPEDLGFCPHCGEPRLVYLRRLGLHSCGSCEWAFDRISGSGRPIG